MDEALNLPGGALRYRAGFRSLAGSRSGRPAWTCPRGSWGRPRSPTSPEFGPGGDPGGLKDLFASGQGRVLRIRDVGASSASAISEPSRCSTRGTSPSLSGSTASALCGSRRRSSGGQNGSGGELGAGGSARGYASCRGCSASSERCPDRRIERHSVRSINSGFPDSGRASHAMCAQSGMPGFCPS
jgi:hypothetical protein